MTRTSTNAFHTLLSARAVSHRPFGAAQQLASAALVAAGLVLLV